MGSTSADYQVPLGDNGPATSATLFGLKHCVADSNADMYMVGANKIRRVGRSDGKIYLVAGHSVCLLNFAENYLLCVLYRDWREHTREHKRRRILLHYKQS